MPRSFSREDVRAIARLARLQLSDDELDLFARQLTGILAYADQVREVDTSAAGGPAPPAIGTPLRPDDPRPSLPRDEIIAGAPDAESGFFKVPRVLS